MLNLNIHPKQYDKSWIPRWNLHSYDCVIPYSGAGLVLLPLSHLCKPDKNRNKLDFFVAVYKKCTEWSGVSGLTVNTAARGGLGSFSLSLVGLTL